MSSENQAMYTIRVECSNCDHSGTLSLPRGTKADGPHDCPNCGCTTARKARPTAEKEWKHPHPWVTNPLPVPQLPYQVAPERKPQPFKVWCGEMNQNVRDDGHFACDPLIEGSSAIPERLRDVHGIGADINAAINYGIRTAATNTR